MGDAEADRGKMDRSNSSSSDEPGAAEKKLKIDSGPDLDANVEMTAVVEDKANANDKSGNGHSAEVQEENKSSPTDSTAQAIPKEESVTETEPKTTDVKPEENKIPADPVDFGEEIELKISFNKKPLLIKIPLKKTVGDLKLLIEKETKVAPALQKVLIKGISKDESTLESLGVTKMTKIMVIGTSLNDVMDMAKAPNKEVLAAEDLSAKKDAANWCSLPQHKKVLDKGVPDDAMPGILNESEPLPDIPLFGMLNSKGGKVRLTFKLELDELWIGTKERTEKLPMGSIRNVESQPITGYEHYHILAIQLGPTEASRYFVYWVPNQYVDAIKDSLAN